jgi:signal transduction histidine kinase/CheY-like chemotaxis protein
MQAFRRSLITLTLAALLPVVVFVAVQVLYTLKRDSAEIEQATLVRAQEVTQLVDARINADLSALRVLTSSSLAEEPDWREFYERARRALPANPHWFSIIVSDARTGDTLFDLLEPFGTPLPPLTLDRATLIDTDRAIVGGMISRGPGSSIPNVYLQEPLRRAGATRFIVTILSDPLIYQNILLEHTSVANVAAVVDHAGRFIARNLNFEDRVGTLSSEYVRKAIPTLSGVYKGKTLEGLENYTAFYTSSYSGWSTHIAFESSIIDGPRAWSYGVAAVAALAALLVAGGLILMVLRELADRRRTEEGLRQSQKMEAIGQLTGGIAHDFNNLLTAIIGGLDIITRRAGDERTQRLATNALEAARRGAKLTSQLLAFSRKQPIAVGTVDLHALLEGMRDLLAQSVGSAVKISIQVAPDARYVISDAAQLELSLLNLAVNARDAMPAGGRFSIRTAPAEDALTAGLAAAEHVQIEVCDTGSGMTEEVSARATEPFFTTKPQGEGTGLGLAQVFGVMRQSNGATHIRSASGAGTTIVLVLPRAPAPAIVKTAIEPSITRAVTRQPSRDAILVADDDRHVRRMMVDSLRGQGYRVAEASGGDEALHLISASKPDLLVIDFSMPGRNGAEVARSAKQIYPDLKVMIVSGHADVAAISKAIGTVPLLPKPFDSATLIEAVAQILDEVDAVTPRRQSS